MDRFNSNEDVKRTFKNEANDIIYSELKDKKKVDVIIQTQENAYLEGQKNIINDLVETMEGVVFIDRKFIEEWVSRIRNNLPIYED